MAPKETSSLLDKQGSSDDYNAHYRLEQQQESFTESTAPSNNLRSTVFVVVSFLLGAVLAAETMQYMGYHETTNSSGYSSKLYYGPYKLSEYHAGQEFFDNYDFLDGPDSLGSAGYNVYISEKKAKEVGIVKVQIDNSTGEEIVYMASAIDPDHPKGYRQSVRLEGKRRYDRGLFILDLNHLPVGCGVWPAWWLTDEDVWPDNGEIDIVEGINLQTTVKTALHTSDRCSMYAHVPPYAFTGEWDSATGLPETYTGIVDNVTVVPADDCWVMAPHRWANQGCVAVNKDERTLGKPLNDAKGGVFVLEWDPANKFIKSWAFPKEHGLPSQLQDVLENPKGVVPNTTDWNVLPYAYFAIGADTGCSADHFKNMRLVFNLAFCGNVAGNRFLHDCPALADTFGVMNPNANFMDPVLTCNKYISSNPKELSEAYWNINGVYVYERE